MNLRIKKKHNSWLVKFKNALLLITIGSIFLVACDEKNENYYHYEELLLTVDNTKIGDFKKAVIDSSGASLEIIASEVHSYLSQNRLDSEFENYFSSYQNSAEAKVHFLCLATHQFLLNGKVDLNKVYSDYKNILNVNSNARIEAVRLVKERNAEINYEQFSLGDTVELCLPVDFFSGEHVAYYFGNGIPSNFDCTGDFFQVVSFKGKLISKTKEAKAGIDNVDVLFTIELISLSELYFIIDGEKVERGDEVVINMTKYGLKI